MTHPTHPPARRLIEGSAWGATAALDTAGWFTVTRMGIGGSFDPFDLAALRYGIPGLLLLPLFWRHRRAILGVPPRVLAVIVVGGGAPFAVVNAAGLTFASAGNGGALVPGMLPLLTAVLSVWALGERIGTGRRVGIAIIMAGILAITGHGLLEGLERTPGHLLFLLAAVMCSGFAVALRASGLAPLPAIATVSVASLLGYVPVYLLLAGPRLLEVPVLATLLGALVLGEIPAAQEAAGVAAISLGAYAASGGRWPRLTPRARIAVAASPPAAE